MFIFDSNFGLLVLLCISSLNVYSIIIAGWSSNSKYAFLGALRSSAQMVSYEISIGLIMMVPMVVARALHLTYLLCYVDELIWVALLNVFSAFIFFISVLAETNRSPFDLPEAEAELVAGYNVEYSSIMFALFFLAEYGNMLAMSIFWCMIFLGSAFIIPDVIFILFLLVLVRAVLPRYRYDQLMILG